MGCGGVPGTFFEAIPIWHIICFERFPLTSGWYSRQQSVQTLSNMARVFLKCCWDKLHVIVERMHVLIGVSDFVELCCFRCSHVTRI